MMVGLKRYLDVPLRRWKTVAYCVLLGIVGAIIYTQLNPTSYTAAVQLYVSAQLDSNPQAAYQGAQLAEKRVTSYAQLVQSERLALTVAQRLNEPTDRANEIMKTVATTTEDDTVLLRVESTDYSADRAARVANAVAASIPPLVAELEAPLARGQLPSVQVRVVDYADPPADPSSPPWALQISLGALAGLLVGFVVATVLSRRDLTIRDASTIVQIVKLPVLCSLPRTDSSNAIEPENSYSPLLEAARQLRTNLKFSRVDKNLRSVLFTSSVAGEGKTRALLAYGEVAAQNERILVVDADLRRPDLSTICGIENEPGLTTVLAGRIDVGSAIHRSSSGFDVMGSGTLPPNPSELLGSERLSQLLRDLEERYDKVLFDTPPVLPVADAASLSAATDGVIVVARYGMTTHSMLESAVRSLGQVNASLIGIVFNDIPDSARTSYGTYYRYARV